MRLQVDLSPELKTRLKMLSVESGKTLSELAEEIFAEYFEESTPTPQKPTPTPGGRKK